MDVLITLTDIFEKLILLMLIGLSIWSITIVIDRRRLFKADILGTELSELKKKIQSANSKNEILQNLGTKSFSERTLTEALKMAQDPSSFERALAGQIKSERMSYEKGLSILATLGANAPFIGLFGTVLGIIRAFAYLGSQSGSSAVISGVSQALYATAMGLLVAIPAVVANNYFAHHLRQAIQKVESLRDFILAKKLV